MEDLDRIASRLEAELDQKDQLRERAMQGYRAVLRASTGAVRAIHQGHDPTKVLEEAVREAGRLDKMLQGHPDVHGSGFVEEALQELAEAAVVHAILSKQPIPEPEDIHCPPVPYLLGLGDAVGELRRAALDAMRAGKTQEAERLLAWMDALFDALIRFDHAMAGHVRRKQDVARSLIEKTRGELTVTQRGRTLEGNIGDLLSELEKGRTKKGKAKPPARDLDLDAESEFRKKKR